MFCFCPKSRKIFSLRLKTLFGEAEIVSSEINAVWFSRASTKKREAWEIRHLSEIPFALFETFEENVDEEILQESLSEMETRLKEKTSKNGQ